MGKKDSYLMFYIFIALEEIWTKTRTRASSLQFLQPENAPHLQSDVAKRQPHHFSKNKNKNLVFLFTF